MRSGNTKGTGKPIRLWPGAVLVTLLGIVHYVVPLLVPGSVGVALLGGLAGGVLVIAWWLLFSRVPLGERFGVLVAAALVTALFQKLAHPSIETGMMGLMFFIYAIPTLCITLVLWARFGRGLSGGLRWASLVLALVAACGVWMLFRSKGVTGSDGAEFAWRWTETAEERLLADRDEAQPVSDSAAIAQFSEIAWPGFRGPQRNSIVTGATVETDWETSPPRELWRQSVGPGWSSFAVAGEVFFTQEQRGEEETVSCYRLDDGAVVWRHGDPVRFWEANAGAGPRATPTLHGNRLLSLGATGIVNVLEAATGRVIWSRNAAEDTDTDVPFWGFSGSPLVVEDRVIVACAGVLVAYDLDTGAPSWVGPDGGNGYSSPHLSTIDGVDQVLLASGTGVTALDPSSGSLLWQHAGSGTAIVQPAQTESGDVLIGQDNGMWRLRVTRETNGWSVEEIWNTNRLKPYFNDFVVREGNAYGFDGHILASIDLESGERQWKGGRYGNGQMLLLADRDLLLVLSEKGELVLVGATPDGFVEHARVPGIEGKTWNHPVLVGDVLLVRNSQEMAAFALTSEQF